jgi:hypothetical protein
MENMEIHGSFPSPHFLSFTLFGHIFSLLSYLGSVWMNGKEKEWERELRKYKTFALLHFWIQTPQSAKGQMLP